MNTCEASAGNNRTELLSKRMNKGIDMSVPMKFFFVHVIFFAGSNDSSAPFIGKFSMHEIFHTPNELQIGELLENVRFS